MRKIQQKKNLVVTSAAAIGLLLGVCLSACSTSQTKALRRVEVGMTKNEVLNIVGDPSRVGREHGQDRWAYVDHESDTSDETTYVFFSEGRVTYVGPSEEIRTPVQTSHETESTVEAVPQNGKASASPAPAKPDSQKFTPVD